MVYDPNGGRRPVDCEGGRCRLNNITIRPVLVVVVSELLVNYCIMYTQRATICFLDFDCE